MWEIVCERLCASTIVCDKVVCQRLCVTKLCVKDCVCVTKLCVKVVVCDKVAEADGGGGGADGIQNQKQEPHTKMWENRHVKPDHRAKKRYKQIYFYLFKGVMRTICHSPKYRPLFLDKAAHPCQSLPI